MAATIAAEPTSGRECSRVGLTGQLGSRGKPESLRWPHVVGVGWLLPFGETFPESSETVDLFGRYFAAAGRDRRDDPLVGFGFQPAATAILEVLGDPAGAFRVEFTIQVALQELADFRA